MVMLGIIGCLLIVGALIWILLFISKWIEKFNGLCRYKYSYVICNKRKLCITIISLAFLVIGFRWYKADIKSGGDILNAIVLIVASLLVLISSTFLILNKVEFVDAAVGLFINYAIGLFIVTLATYLYDYYLLQAAIIGGLLLLIQDAADLRKNRVYVANMR